MTLIFIFSFIFFFYFYCCNKHQLYCFNVSCERLIQFQLGVVHIIGQAIHATNLVYIKRMFVIRGGNCINYIRPMVTFCTPQFSRQISTKKKFLCLIFISLCIFFLAFVFLFYEFLLWPRNYIEDKT